jgi:hypothetical protein
MHASVGGQVETTLSTVRRYRTGLPGAETHERGGQDLGDFIEPLGGRHAVGVKRVHRPIAGNAIEDAEEPELRKKIRWLSVRLRRNARVSSRCQRAFLDALTIPRPAAMTRALDSRLDNAKEHN